MMAKDGVCRMCRQPLFREDSPFGPDIEQAAASHQMCPMCYAAQAEAFIFMQSMMKRQACEHSWGQWLVVDSTDEELYLVVKTCKLCALVRSKFSELPVQDDPELDISWCDLDRTIPEP